MDKEVYCRISSENGFHYNSNIPAAALWRREHDNNAPLNKDFYITLGLGVGGFNNFANVRKPWKEYSTKALNRFWKAMKPLNNWPGEKSTLKIDYVKVFAL